MDEFGIRGWRVKAVLRTWTWLQRSQEDRWVCQYVHNTYYLPFLCLMSHTLWTFYIMWDQWQRASIFFDAHICPQTIYLWFHNSFNMLDFFIYYSFSQENVHMVFLVVEKLCDIITINILSKYIRLTQYYLIRTTQFSIKKAEYQSL